MAALSITSDLSGHLCSLQMDFSPLAMSTDKHPPFVLPVSFRRIVHAKRRNKASTTDLRLALVKYEFPRFRIFRRIVILNGGMNNQQPIWR